jgi:hypothetical protein
MKTQFDSERPLDLEGLLFGMRNRINIGDQLGDFALSANLSPREKVLATALMCLRDDWDIFETDLREWDDGQHQNASPARRPRTLLGTDQVEPDQKTAALVDSLEALASFVMEAGERKLGAPMTVGVAESVFELCQAFWSAGRAELPPEPAVADPPSIDLEALSCEDLCRIRTDIAAELYRRAGQELGIPGTPAETTVPRG